MYSFCHHQLIMDHGNPRSVNLLLQAMTAVSLLPKYMFRHVDKQHWCGYKNIVFFQQKFSLLSVCFAGWKY